MTEIRAHFIRRTDAANRGTEGLAAMLNPAETMHPTVHPTAEFGTQREPSQAS